MGFMWGNWDPVIEKQKQKRNIRLLNKLVGHIGAQKIKIQNIFNLKSTNYFKKC